MYEPVDMFVSLLATGQLSGWAGIIATWDSLPSLTSAIRRSFLRAKNTGSPTGTLSTIATEEPMHPHTKP